MSIDLLGPVVGGAAGALVAKVIEKGPEWLVALVAGHSDAVRDRLQQNSAAFVRALASRIERLEAESADRAERLGAALDQPGTSLLIQKSLRVAACTDDDERHSILAELIAHRLVANENDLVALAGGVACDLIAALAPLHLRLLAVSAALFKIRPGKPHQVSRQEEYDAYLDGWWSKRLDVLCTPDLLKVTAPDWEHLVALSCLTFSIGVHVLMPRFRIPADPPTFDPNMFMFEQKPWWPSLQHVWEGGLSHASLTSTGALIGALTHDRLTGRTTSIQWPLHEVAQRPSPGT